MGEYEVLDYRGENRRNQSLTKHLRIDAGKYTSFQRHTHRSETWVVVEGTGEVILNGEVKGISRGDTILAPAGADYAVKADTDLHIIEVQVCGELVEGERGALE